MWLVWRVALHDLRQWARSPATVAAGLLPALGMGVLVAVLTASVGQQPVALVVEGQGPLATRMAELIVGDTEAYILQAMDRPAADRALQEQRMAAGLRSPGGGPSGEG